MDNKPRVLVTMLSWDHLPFSQLAIKFLLKNTSPKHTILVIDQGSNKDTLDFLRKTKEAGFIELIENGENKGIAGAINQGMKIAIERNMDFCFFSNDVIAGYRWLEELQDGVYKHDKIGGASPYIGPEATYDEFINMEFRNRYRNIYWPRLKNDPDYQILHELIDEIHGGDFQGFTENWVETRKEIPPLFEWFSMVMYIKKSTIEKVGFFDEQFFPSHWEDLDYMVRMNNNGLYRVGVTGSYCFHFSTITTRSEWRDGDQELRTKANDNERKFNEKWRIFLPYNLRREGIPDGDKYSPKKRGPKLDDFFPISEAHQSRYHDEWHTWQEFDNLNKGN